MEVLVDLLILFITLGCVFKLSLWTRWQRAFYSLLLAAFAVWSVRYAVLQSKTQLAALLQQADVVRNLAVLVTIEAAVAMAYCFRELDGSRGASRLSRLADRLLYGYASLLMFPAVFYLLTQTVFALAGADYDVVGVSFGVAIAVLLPLLAEGASRVLPRRTDRVEMLLLLVVVVALLGLAATTNGTLVYTGNLQDTTRYMELISRALFGIANALLIPDIVLLIFFFLRALVVLIGTYSGFMARRAVHQQLDAAIKELQPDGIAQLRSLLHATGRHTRFTACLADLLAHPASEAYADYLITQYETEAAKEVNLSRLLTKLGPVLGLIGTLISMSPALVGLSTGDISGMAYNMQVVFSATVVGLVISAVGLFTQQLKSRWFAKDVSRLDYVSRIYQQSDEKTAQQ